MRCLFRWFLRLVVVLFGLAVLLYLAKDSILRRVAEHRLRARTGLDVQIGRLSSGILSPVVTISDFKVFNSAAYGGTPFLNIPELHLELDAEALSRHQIHVKLMRFNLAELDVVRNEAGQTNIYSILDKVKAEASKEGSNLPNLLKDFEFTGIDVLNLTLGKACFVDLKDPKHNREIRVDLRNQVFRDVKSDADLYGILFMVWLRSGGNFALAPAHPDSVLPPQPAAPHASTLEKPAVTKKP
jgi:hypothetical protein